MFFCISHLFSLFHLSPSSIFCHFSRVFAYSNASHSSFRLISILMDGFISAHQLCARLTKHVTFKWTAWYHLLSPSLSVFLSFCPSVKDVGCMASVWTGGGNWSGTVRVLLRGRALTVSYHFPRGWPSGWCYILRATKEKQKPQRRERNRWEKQV